MAGGVALQGDKTLTRQLQKLSTGLASKEKKKVLRKASRPILRDARAKVQRDTGMLRISLGLSVKEYKTRDVIVGAIWARGKFRSKKRAELTGSKANRRPVNYAHLVEFGTAPHMQRNVVISDGNEKVVLGTLIHPGARKKPFLRPALDKNKRNALDLMVSGLKSAVRQRVRRLR